MPVGFATSNGTYRHGFRVQENLSGNSISVKERLLTLVVTDSCTMRYCFPGVGNRVKRGSVHITGIPKRKKIEYGEIQFLKRERIRIFPN